MASRSRPEGLEIVLTQMLVAVLTLITVVPLLAFLDLDGQVTEWVVGFIVFGAWFLVTSMVVPLIVKRVLGRGPEQTP